MHEKIKEYMIYFYSPHVWLERCRDKLNAIDAAAKGQKAFPPKEELQQLEACRQRACFHLREAKFWMERQQAWIVPMER